MSRSRNMSPIEMERKKGIFAQAFEIVYHHPIVKGQFWKSFFAGLIGGQYKYKSEQPLTLNNPKPLNNRVTSGWDTNIYNWAEFFFAFPIRFLKNLLKFVIELIPVVLYLNLKPGSYFSYIPLVLARIGQTFTSPITAVSQTAEGTLERIKHRSDSNGHYRSWVYEIPGILGTLLHVLLATCIATAYLILTATTLFSLLHYMGLGGVVVACVNFANYLGSIPFLSQLGSLFISLVAKVGAIVGLNFATSGLLPAISIAGSLLTVIVPVAVVRWLLRQYLDISLFIEMLTNLFRRNDVSVVEAKSSLRSSSQSVESQPLNSNSIGEAKRINRDGAVVVSATNITDRKDVLTKSSASGISATNPPLASSLKHTEQAAALFPVTTIPASDTVRGGSSSFTTTSRNPILGPTEQTNRSGSGTGVSVVSGTANITDRKGVLTKSSASGISATNPPLASSLKHTEQAAALFPVTTIPASDTVRGGSSSFTTTSRNPILGPTEQTNRSGSGTDVSVVSGTANITGHDGALTQSSSSALNADPSLASLEHTKEYIEESVLFPYEIVPVANIVGGKPIIIDPNKAIEVKILINRRRGNVPLDLGNIDPNIILSVDGHSFTFRKNPLRKVNVSDKDKKDKDERVFSSPSTSTGYIESVFAQSSSSASSSSSSLAPSEQPEETVLFSCQTIPVPNTTGGKNLPLVISDNNPIKIKFLPKPNSDTTSSSAQPAVLSLSNGHSLQLNAPLNQIIATLNLLDKPPQPSMTASDTAGSAASSAAGSKIILGQGVVTPFNPTVPDLNVYLSPDRLEFRLGGDLGEKFKNVIPPVHQEETRTDLPPQRLFSASPEQADSEAHSSAQASSNQPAPAH